MFMLYANKIGEDIEHRLESTGIIIRHSKDYYNPLGLNNEKLKSDIESHVVSEPFFVVAFEYKYITNFECTRYFTQNENGQFSTWNYDFNVYMPVKCHPVVLLCNSASGFSSRIHETLLSLYSEGSNVLAPHPIMPNEFLPFTVKSNNVNGPIIERDGFTYINCFENELIPWSNGKEVYDMSELTNKRLKLVALSQVRALFELSGNAAEYYGKESNRGEKEKEKARELIAAISNKRIILLERLGIPESLWSIEKIDRVMQVLRSQEKDSSLKQAVDVVQREISEAEKNEAKRFIREAMAASGFEQYSENREEYADDGYYSSYDDSYGYESSNGSSGFFSSLAASFIANQGVKKAIKEQTATMERIERERKNRENEERSRRARQSQIEWENVRKANMERRRKGLPDLPYPHREYW